MSEVIWRIRFSLSRTKPAASLRTLARARAPPTRASSSRAPKGLTKQSSAPACKPSTRDSSPARAERMIPSGLLNSFMRHRGGDLAGGDHATGGNQLRFQLMPSTMLETVVILIGEITKRDLSNSLTAGKDGFLNSPVSMAQ